MTEMEQLFGLSLLIFCIWGMMVSIKNVIRTWKILKGNDWGNKEPPQWTEQQDKNSESSDD